jgi:FMN-dependent NADH-azoreductase
MSSILVINSSVSGDASVSKLLVEEALANLRTADANASVAVRDLGEGPVPHLTPDAAAGLRREEPANDAQREARALSDELIGELEAADTIVIGAPMYNFGIASGLKAWFDYVLRPGRTFRYSETGPEGVLKGKRAIVVVARGGLYSSGPAKAMDSQEPHLRTLLGFIGITDVTFVRAEKLGFGPAARDQSILDARAELGQLADATLRQAA